MLTTSLAKPRKMPLAMPSDGPPTGWSDKRTMTIDLGKNNKMLCYLGMVDKPFGAPKVVANSKELQEAITETGKQVLASTGKNLIVLIKPADHSVYGNLVDALDILNILNIQTYAISPVSPKDADFNEATWLRLNIIMAG